MSSIFAFGSSTRDGSSACTCTASVGGAASGAGSGSFPSHAARIPTAKSTAPDFIAIDSSSDVADRILGADLLAPLQRRIAPDLIAAQLLQLSEQREPARG